MKNQQSYWLNLLKKFFGFKIQCLLYLDCKLKSSDKKKAGLECDDICFVLFEVVHFCIVSVTRKVLHEAQEFVVLFD